MTLSAHSFDRRSFLAQACSAAGVAFVSSTLPAAPARGEERFPGKLRDLNRSYELWREQTAITSFPSFETFERAVQMCRRAVCGVHHMQGEKITGSHSGFVIAIPEEHQTQLARSKAFIVTCDHARTVDPMKPVVSVLLMNGRALHPERQLVSTFGDNGYPKNDLRILEFNARSLADVNGIPLGAAPQPMPVNSPILTYEPMGFRASARIDTASQTLQFLCDPSVELPLEKFILTYVSDPAGLPEPDSNYPLDTGFLTAGQLESGGSGSPALMFEGDTFFLAGYQVAQTQERTNVEAVDGELRHDGHVVHVENVVSLLKRHGYWK